MKLKAFSLIELLVTVSIMAVLLAIILPAMGKARRVSQISVCGSNLRQTGSAMTMYQADWHDTYPAASDNEGEVRLWMGRGWRNMLMPYITEGIDKDNPSVLYCPADAADPEQYENTSYAYSMSFYHSPAQIDSMNSSSFCYSSSMPAVSVRSTDVTYPSDKILAGEWTSNHKPVDSDNGWWCWTGTRNFLFADRHIEFLNAKNIHPANDNYPDPNLTENGYEGIDR